MSEQNTKLKGDLKRATDELNEMRAQAERTRTEAAKYGETQSLIMVLRSREEESKSLIASLQQRLRVLEEELHSRIVDSEDVHQINMQTSMERKALLDKLSTLEA